MRIRKLLHVVDRAGEGLQDRVSGTGIVLPVPFSHKGNRVGTHWVRISFAKKRLAELVKWLSKLWGDPKVDGFGLWSYDSRISWASGASLNYDADEERSQRVHLGSMTLDIPGAACDELTAPDLQLLFEYCEFLEGRCTRLDVFFDDYVRFIYPRQLDEVIARNDFSGLRHAAVRHKWDGGKLIREEVSFGERGSFGNGKYLRFYNKELESSGEQKCNRWEVEFTGKKANQVFHKLAGTAGDLDAFALLISALVAGSIIFVHRTGDRNIQRLELYDWWKDICNTLGGCVTIRTARKKDSLTGKITWVKRNVSPSLACIRRTFVTDRAFFRWLFDVTHDGEGRMNPFSEQIARENEGTLDYHWGQFSKNEDIVYDRAVSEL